MQTLALLGGAAKFWTTAEALASSPFPEREQRRIPAIDRMLRIAIGTLRARNPLAAARAARFARDVEALAPDIAAMSDFQIRAEADRLRPILLRNGFRRAPTARSFALVREMSQRRLGKRHRPVQLAGGYVMLHGALAEMATGEGKTITAMLPAVTAALAGLPVHVITVNDYLAERDFTELRPVYEALGLTVELIVHDRDPAARRRAYDADIVYVNNKEITFDHLRDRVAVPSDFGSVRSRLDRLLRPEALGGTARMVMRGLHFAIVDEADSILIDDARTPLILSREDSGGQERSMYETALAIARRMERGVDYTLSIRERQVRLTSRGRRAAALLVPRDGSLLDVAPAREDLVRQALTALHLFQRDRDYILRDGTVQIVDESTGRVMEDRSWQGGLHQLIEVKEELEHTTQKRTIARMSYKKFFSRYRRLAGMTGTAINVAGELYADYDLGTVRIPTNEPVRRVEWPRRVLVTDAARWREVAASAAEIARSGRPVLVGTRSVDAAEKLSAILTAGAVAHRVLSARQDADEASAIAEAGQAGRITVATNMAGRGTDILPSLEALAAGGLHVILTEYHESRRIDRQLFGRAGRQGQPGSCQAIVCLQDEIFTRFAPWRSGLVRRVFAQGDGTVQRRAGELLRRTAQGVAERHGAAVRRENAAMDERLAKALAVSGRGE